MRYLESELHIQEKQVQRRRQNREKPELKNCRESEKGDVSRAHGLLLQPDRWMAVLLGGGV